MYIGLEHDVGAGSDFLVGEKLLSFVEVSEKHPEVARALPWFGHVQMDVTPKGDNRFLQRLDRRGTGFAKIPGCSRVWPTITERTIMAMDRTPSRTDHDKTYRALPGS